MKNKILVLLFLIASQYSSFSQTATQSKLNYQRTDKVAAVIELPYSPDIVEGAINSRLQSATVKEEKLKGLLVYKGGRLTPADGEVVDFYFNVNRKGSKEVNTSTVYLILGRPGENVALRTLNDDFRIQDAKKFLDDLVPVVAAYKLETDIQQQDELLKRSESNLNKLTSEQQELEEKIRDLQERLAQNKRDQQTQNADLLKQRTTRDALVQKKTVTGK